MIPIAVEMDRVGTVSDGIVPMMSPPVLGIAHVRRRTNPSATAEPVKQITASGQAKLNKLASSMTGLRPIRSESAGISTA
jgi:hypothetical protein